MEVTMVLAALGLGFASGFHCIGMCGPIALTLGLTRNQALKFQIQNLTYNLGRITTYTILGALLGIFGETFSFAGLQQYLTIFAGICLIVMALFSFGGKDFASKIPLLTRGLQKVKSLLGALLQRSDLKSRYLTGIVNGLLPCGMVYMALTASLAAGGIYQSALFMLLFGLGTFPFMFMVVYAGSLMTQALRIKILKWVPVLMIILGMLFIVRGLELGIPYLSPKKEALEIRHNDSQMHHHGDHSSCH